jgi:hypothetical protein
MTVRDQTQQDANLRRSAVSGCAVRVTRVKYGSIGLSYALLPHLDPNIVLLPQVMKRFASKLLAGASPARVVRKAEVRPDQSTTILNNATVVFQRLTDLGSAGSNVVELPVAGRIGTQIVEIVKVRPKTLIV